MAEICISDLHKKQIDRKNNEQKIFDLILSKCYNRIKLVAYRSGDSSCFFQLPEFVFGIPIYNAISCAKFIIKNLINKGFIVIYTHPNLLYISWDIRYTKQPPKPIDTKIENHQKKFKLISDYKPSGQFLDKIKESNIDISHLL